MSDAFDGPRSQPPRKPASSKLPRAPETKAFRPTESKPPAALESKAPSGPAGGPARLSPLALISAIIGGISPLLTIACLMSLPTSAIAVVLGHVARHKIRRSEGKERGAGLALVGMIFGYLTFAGSLVAAGFLWVNLPAREPKPIAAPNSPESVLGDVKAEILVGSGKGKGNTPDAIRLSERFAELMESMHHEAFTKTRTKIKLSFGHYVTWCERHEGTCAFVVHVPEYRKFSPDAKALLDTLAWETAKRVVEDELKPGERLAVGLRGPLLYGSIMVGTVGGDGNVGGALSTGTDEDSLYPFFDREHAVPAVSARPVSAEPERLPIDYRPIVRSTPPGSVNPPLSPDPLMNTGVPPYGGRPIAETSTNPSTYVPDPGLPPGTPGNPGTPPTTADGLPDSAAPEPLTTPPGLPSRRRRPTGPRSIDRTIPLPEVPPRVSPAELAKQSLVVPQSVEEAISLLDAESPVNRSMAHSFLASHKPDEPNSEVADKLVASLGKASIGEAMSIGSALESWVTPEQLSELTKLLESKDSFTRHKVQQIIAKIDTLDAAKVLAKGLADRRDRFQAATALKSMGKIAEPAVIPFLSNKDTDVCLEACRILQEIGTKKSMSGLMKAAKSKNLLLSTTAKMALDQVRGRGN